YLIYFKCPQIVFRLNERVVVYKHAENPAIFNAATGIAAIVAILFLASGARVLLGQSEGPSSTTTPRPRAFWRAVWGILNTSLLLRAVWSGYAAMTPSILT